jgi:Zn-finger nucleic acid-binding protein
MYIEAGSNMSGTGVTETAAFNCPNCGAAANTDSQVCIYCGSSIAARICPSCFGNVAVGMKHCPLCGAVVSDSNLKGASSLKCPLCDRVLSLAKVGKHSLYECVRCGGLWIEKNCFQAICTIEEEQEAVLRFRFEENPDPGKNRTKRKRAYIPCPECGKLMNHKNFSHCSGIILDWCRDHGSWFDRRELQQIVSFIRNGGLQKARERERRNLQVEKERLRMKEFKIATYSNRAGTPPGGMIDFDQSGPSILDFLQEVFFD